MNKKASAGERILGSMKQITEWAEGDKSAARVTSVPSIDVRKIRRRLKMTQSEFASKFGLPAAVVSNWEQGRNTPDTAARVLLAVIDRHPEAVADTLSNLRRAS